MNSIHNLCVFASSSQNLEQAYYATARALGAAMARSGLGLVFGGGNIGLMGATARGATEAGANARVIGVIPEKLHQPGIVYPGCTELIVTDTMHARKQTMENRADGFITLPGGFGTLEELLEVLTLKQLGYHEKPIILINQNGFFDPLLEQFELLFATGFSHIAYRALYSVALDAEEAVALALSYTPPAMPDKMKEALKGDGST